MHQKSAWAVIVICTMLIAATKTITDETAGVSIDLPDADGWKTAETKTAGQRTTTTSHADGVSILLIRFDRQLPSVVIKRLADSFEPIMKDAKVAEDGTDQVTVHGIQADKVSGTATRQEKPIQFTALLLGSGNNNTLALIAFGPEAALKRHQSEIKTTFDSVRPKQ